MMRTRDRGWDQGEGRYVPQVARPHRALGLLGQYVTGTPHMRDESLPDPEDPAI